MYLELSRLDDRMPLMTSDKVFSNMVGGWVRLAGIIGAIFVVSGLRESSQTRMDVTALVPWTVHCSPGQRSTDLVADSAERDDPTLAFLVLLLLLSSSRNAARPQ
jgi:hypothetical protein